MWWKGKRLNGCLVERVTSMGVEQITNLPKHVAIIMDGNGRWAKQRLLPRAAGHRAGAKAVRNAIEFAVAQRIDVLTLFALSIENLRHRPEREVNLLLDLFMQSLLKNTQELHTNNVRIHIIGDYSCLKQKLYQQIEKTQQLTANNTGLNLVIAVNYSGRWDITQATTKLASKVAKQQLVVTEISEQLLNQELCLSQFAEPDLLIRTGNEQRISNFMLWQLAYTEFFFTDVYWPDFDRHTFSQAIQDYQARQRRYGLTPEQLEAEKNA